MPVASALELPGSPTELSSWALSTVFGWDPTVELLVGEIPTLPVCVVLQYNPQYPVDFANVSATVLSSSSPSIGTGVYAKMVLVKINAAVLQVGYEYRFDLTTTGSLGTTLARYFRVICKV